MTINRIEKINKVAQTATLIHKANAFRSIWKVISCRTGKPYQVTVEWGKDDNGIATITGSLFTFDPKEAKFNDGRRDNHPANYGNSPACYQVLGVAKAMAKAKGMQLSFCNSYEDAIRLTSLHGQVIKIVKPSGRAQWAVAIEVSTTKNMSREDRVSLLRGKVEGGID